MRMHTRTLTKAALLPAAVLMAIGGSGVALASGAAPAGHVTGSVSAPETYYTMQLSPSSATVRSAGGVTRTVISFRATDNLYGTAVDLSLSGLPSGARASFTPRTTIIGGRSVLTVTTAPRSPAGTFAVTVTAITESSDPIGTSTTFNLTVGTR